MQSKRARLDRFVSVRTGVARRDVRSLLAQGRVLVDGSPAVAIHQLVDEFTHVRMDGRVLQANTPFYLMMNKPIGVVSATKDEQHETVVDLLRVPYGKSLHIVGRLDYNSSGMILLTNNGRWSRQLTTPENKVAKVYRVVLANPVTEECVDAFIKGIYFPYEGITTRPAKLDLVDAYTADVTLVEGRYHQIKRMFGRFRNPVLSLHRSAIGSVPLDVSLAPGSSRELTEWEVKALARA